MLNLDVSELENLKMEEQVHLTITATICGTVFAIIYYFSTLKESYIAHEHYFRRICVKIPRMPSKDSWTGWRTGAVCLGTFYFFYGAGIAKEFYYDYIEAMMRKSMGLEAGDAPSRRAPPPLELGPHSYMTLLLSAGCCAAILLLIYLVKATPFESLVKMTPLHKLIQMIINGRGLDEVDEGAGAGTGRRRLSQDTISSRERVLETCVELERRLGRLEQCLVPLLQSLDLLTQHADNQSVVTGPDKASSELSSPSLDADPAAEADTEPGSADLTDPSELNSNLRFRKRSVSSEPN